jgi:hypothetical protein
MGRWVAICVLVSCGRLNFHAADDAPVDDSAFAFDAPPGLHWIGGTLAGATGPVVLRDNGADDLTLATNGGFMFATPLASGQTYAVTVATTPSGQTCNLGNASGTVANVDVSNVHVTCFAIGSDPGILCAAGQYCTPGTQSCCFKQGGNGQCHSLGVACSTSTLTCDDAADCGGALCCAYYDTILGDWGSQCDASCPPPAMSQTAEIWCDPNAPNVCPGATSCTGMSQLAGRFTCQ